MINRKKIVFIINPVSGVGKKNSIPPLIEKELDHTQFTYTIEYTKYRGHGAELAKQLKNTNDAIIAVGGDGSVNEIGSALVHSSCALGIIPCGSGNGLARHAKIPLKYHRAIRRINAFNVTQIDVGEVNGTIFLGTCGFGFDAHVAKKFDEYHKRGFWSYIKLVIREFNSFVPQKFVFDLNGKHYEREALMCSVANSSQFGNGFTISPMSELTDGKFELIFVKKLPVSRIPGIAGRFFFRSIHKSDLFESFEFSEHLKISTLDEKKTYLHIDGDPGGENSSFNVQIHSGALKLL